MHLHFGDWLLTQRIKVKFHRVFLKVPWGSLVHSGELLTQPTHSGHLTGWCVLFLRSSCTFSQTSPSTLDFAHWVFVFFYVRYCKSFPRFKVQCNLQCFQKSFPDPLFRCNIAPPHFLNLYSSRHLLTRLRPAYWGDLSRSCCTQPLAQCMVQRKCPIKIC